MTYLPGPFGHDYEMLTWTVATLRADPVLNEHVYSLTPQKNDFDLRIYSAYVQLPPDPDIRAALPRITVEALGGDAGYQQQSAAHPQGGVSLWTYTTVPAEQEQLGEMIDARVRYIFASTPVSSQRIIASGLVPIGQRRREREAALVDAWRIVSQFAADLVGVL